MTDPINEWRQAGTVHLWRYKPEKSGLKGWHLTGDTQGLQSIAKLLELLCAATYPAKRTVNLTKPCERIANGPFSPLGGRKVIALVSLQLSIDANDPEDLWEMERDGERAKLRLGRESAMEILGGFRELKERGYGDFSVGPTRGERPQNIWFW